jgi:hypothetical protein
MIRTSSKLLAALTFTLGLSALGCESGGVGDPCIPEDEYRQDFNGFASSEVNIESKSFQCETRVCIVNHFQGRVSCPYGQKAEMLDDGANPLPPDHDRRCRIPGTDGTTLSSIDQSNIDEIRVPVEPQLVERNADNTVYCSCRCKGPDPNARYCECPSGYECSELVRELGLPGRAQLAGSYCVKAGTVYNPRGGGSADVCNVESTSEQPGCGPVGKNP